MENLVLKRGDLVKYFRQSDALDEWGFKLGQVYEVTVSAQGSLMVHSDTRMGVNLVSAKGLIAYFTDHFTRLVPPIELPRSLDNGESVNQLLRDGHYSPKTQK